MATINENNGASHDSDRSVVAAYPSVDALLPDEAAEILRSTPDFVLIADATGQLRFMNGAARHALGVQSEETLAGMRWNDFVPSGSNLAFPATLSLATASGAWTGEGLLQRRDGTQLPVFQTVLLGEESDGDSQRVTIIARDMTEREQTLRRLQTRAMALEAVSEGILVTAPWRRDNPIVYVNPAFERLAGHPSHEVLGRNPRILLGEKTDQAVVEQIETAISQQKPLKCELLMYRADGSTFWSALSLAVLHDEHARMRCCVMMVSDISHQRQVEEHLRQSQKMDSIGRLAGGIAHDFNNLLTVIMGSAELATKLAQQGKDVGECVEDISGTAQRAAALTRQLLAFSRKQVVLPRPLDVNGLIDGYVSLLRRMIREDVLLEVNLAASPSLVIADQSQLEQVLLNLAVNGRDAMPDGGTLRIETETVHLTEDCLARHPDARLGPHVLIRVSDTGVGMAADVAGQIFEPFFTTKKPGQGTGMGLATVFGIVKQSEGQITVSTEPGRGTTFSVYLPSAKDSPRSSGPMPAMPRSNEGTETVLVVEDESTVRRVATHFLEACGYRVLGAGDGPSACEIADRHPGPIDLIVLDVVMPGMNGPEVAERITRRRPETKILFVSGYTDVSLIRRQFSSGEASFLQKPYNHRTLTEKVRQVLDASAIGRSQVAR